MGTSAISEVVRAASKLSFTGIVAPALEKPTRCLT